jgi:hypothetical protein
MPLTLIFANKTKDVHIVAASMVDLGEGSIEVIHEDLTQSDRDFAIERFRDGHSRGLVTTYVSARGLHIPGVEHVVRYDEPAEKGVQWDCQQSKLSDSRPYDTPTEEEKRIVQNISSSSFASSASSSSASSPSSSSSSSCPSLFSPSLSLIPDWRVVDAFNAWREQQGNEEETMARFKFSKAYARCLGKQSLDPSIQQLAFGQTTNKNKEFDFDDFGEVAHSLHR